MRYLIGKHIFVAHILCVLLISTGCNTFNDPTLVETVEIEAQSVPKATPTNTPKPTLTPLPKPSPTTELLTEIIESPAIVEPISPVSPVAITEESVMTANDDSIQLIPGSEAALAAAIADLSQQLNVPLDQIKLVSMEAIEWSDAGLGCPQEGFMYAQVITPGYLLILEVQNQQYKYHTDQQTNIILCDK